MAAPRFTSRLALLELELRRLLREPWLAYAAFMLVPVSLAMLLAQRQFEATPGLGLFRIVTWWWCLAAHIVFIPLMGGAFRGEEKHDELEALQVAGFSPLSLFAGVLVSRLVTALAVLVVPVPLLVLCHLLGGLPLRGLVAATLYLPVHFLLLASLYGALGILLRRDTAYWLFSCLLAGWILFTGAEGLHQRAFRGHFHAVNLVTQATGDLGFDILLKGLAGAVNLLLAGWLCLWLRLRLSTLAEPEARARGRLMAVPERPRPFDAVRWKERWFGLGGVPGRWIRRGWGPVAVVICIFGPALFHNGGRSGAEAMMLGFFIIPGAGLLFSLAHGILSAHRLFAREQMQRTVDDLLLARGEAFGIVHEKLQEFRSSSLDIWGSCVAAMYVGFLIMVALMPGSVPDEFSLFVVLVVPVAVFLVFRLQECFVTRLFQSWSREEGSSGVQLVREAAWFVAAILGYLFLIPLTLMLTFFTLIFALVLIPLVIWAWIRHFNRSLRRRQREFVRAYCRALGDSQHHPELNRLYPALEGPRPRVKSFIHPPPPPAPRW